mgnify:CR=1 FL=1
MSTSPRRSTARVDEDVRRAWIQILDLGVRRAGEAARATGCAPSAVRTPGIATLP